jgi:hypothetical protein
MIHPYATEAYARSLSHWGETFRVPEWGCDVLLREVVAAPDGGAVPRRGAVPRSGTELVRGVDAAGTYPIAVLPADADLGRGLERLRQHGVISVTLVMDDFHRPPLEELRRHFSVVRPFKTHHIRRTALPFAYDKHHRYEVRRSLHKVMAMPFDLGHQVGEWAALYGDLMRRHDLSGIHDFSADHYEALGRMAGVTAIGAFVGERLVSAHLWVSDGRCVHSHLAASNSEGYELNAAYAVYDASIRHFADAELLNFGGGAGVSDDPSDGLARFKRGFANDTAPAYVCGAVLDAVRYDELVRHNGVAPDTLFFPAYRARTI